MALGRVQSLKKAFGNLGSSVSVLLTFFEKLLGQHSVAMNFICLPLRLPNASL
jgi:hypothetical protein